MSKVRLVVDIEIDSDERANHKISEQEVADNLEIVCDDVVDGILIF